MRWYGILAILFFVFLLGGVVYVGAKPDRIGFDFGEPSAISKGHIAPTMPLFEFKISSLTTGYSSQDKIDLEKFQRELQEAILEAPSPREVEQIIEEYTTELFSNNNFEDACSDSFKHFQKLHNIMGKMDMTKFAIEYEDEWRQTAKEVTFCGYGFYSGIFDINDPKWREVKSMVEN